MTTRRTSKKKIFLKTLSPVVIVILLVIGTLFIIKTKLVPLQKSEGTVEVTEGNTLPDFNLIDTNGESRSVSSIPGKVFLINFWATWCEACLSEMPSIVELWKEYKDRGFQVLAINLDENPEAVIPKVIKQLGIKFPVFLDREGKIADLFDVHAIPLTVIVDQNRRILLVKNGEKDWNEPKFQSQLEQWLSVLGKRE